MSVSGSHGEEELEFGYDGDVGGGEEGGGGRGEGRRGARSGERPSLS